MMLPTAWNASGVQPLRRSREGMNTIEDSESDKSDKKEMPFNPYSSSQEQNERKLRPNRKKTRYEKEDEDYFALEEESEEEDDELGSDQDFEELKFTTTRRSNRISKRKYESSQGSLSELQPYFRQSLQKSQFASSRTSRAYQSRSSNREIQQLDDKIREQQKKQAKVEPYILYFTEKNPNLLSVCQFCKRTLGHESSYIGPFKRDDSKCQIQNSNFVLEDLPEKAFIHLECLRSNDITYEYRLKRADPSSTMWVAIVDFFLCKLSDEEPKECTRCNDTNFTVTCFEKQCEKVFHGHICAELNGMNLEIDGYLRFKCYECLWRKRTGATHSRENDYVLLEKVDRSGLYRFSPKNLSTYMLKMKENHEKDIPKGIKNFIDMSQEEFTGELLNYSEDDELYAQEQYTSLQAAYKFEKDYMPQIGDEVVFIPQKYQEILSENWMLVEGLKNLEESVITNLREILELTDCPFSKGGIPVKIIELIYLFPNLKGLRYCEIHKLDFPSIILKLTLEVQQDPSSPNTEEEVKEEKNQKQLTVYLTTQNLSCFVDLETYEVTLREYIKENASTNDLKYLNGTEQQLAVGGKVRINSSYIYEVSTFPFSFYKCFGAVLLDEDGKQEQEVLLSPWDLKPQQSSALKEENLPFKLRQEIVRRFYEILSERKKDFYWFFTFVKSSVAENYQSIIPVESNTNLIMKRLVFDYYRRREALERDIELIRDNAYEYNQNEEDTLIRGLAHECTEQMLGIVKDCFQRKEEILSKIPIGTLKINMKHIKPQVEYEEHYEDSQEDYEDPISSGSSQEGEDQYAESPENTGSKAPHKFRILNDSNPQFLTPSYSYPRRSSRNRSGEPPLTKVELKENERSKNVIKIPISGKEDESKKKRRNPQSIEVLKKQEGQVIISIDKKQRVVELRILQPSGLSVQTRSKARKYI